MPKIIAYTYEADYHCCDCTRDRFPGAKGQRDECGVYSKAVDSEGNPLHPVFEINEVPPATSCATCKAEITKPLRKFRVRLRRLVIEHYDVMARDEEDACDRYDMDGIFAYTDDKAAAELMGASEIKKLDIAPIGAKVVPHG